MTNNNEPPHVNRETVGKDGEVLFTKEQIEGIEARDHGGHGPTRRLLLYLLTKNTHELAANIRKDPKLQEACVDLAECSFEYFEWLDSDREILRCAQARLLLALEVVEPPPGSKQEPKEARLKRVK